MDVTAKLRRILLKFRHEPLLLGVRAILQEVLEHKVAKDVLGESQHVHEQVVRHARELGWPAVLEEPLQDPAPEGMPRHANCASWALGQELVDDELDGVGPQCRDALLQHMIGMTMSHGLPHVAPQLQRQCLARGIAGCRRERGLHHAATVALARQEPDAARELLAGVVGRGLAGEVLRELGLNWLQTRRRVQLASARRPERRGLLLTLHM
mmetsp:Transcript_79575/g.233976  ORF Transcript_79575/g.233976 Transcript_79575/m.233976 type:complete len:211 (-) Transcript_79575:323-955(-)